jgi:hypothetical protein
MSKRAVVSLLVLLVVAGACGKTSQYSAGSGKTGKPAAVTDNVSKAEPPVSLAQPGEAKAATGSGDGSGAAADGSGGSAGTFSARSSQVGAPDIGAPVPILPNIPPSNTKVIKTADLQVRIAKGSFQQRFDRALAVADSLGGFVNSSTVTESKGKVASGDLTIRVPSDRFETALGRLKALGKVTSDTQSGQDVSKEFVDLEARLNQAKAQEGFYLKLMDQAKSISDMIQIQSQLSQIQLQIEEIQGQLQYLKDQTTYSTITAHIYEPGASVVTPHPRGLARAWQGAVDGFKSVVGGVIVGAGWLSPFVLFGLIAYGVYRVARRRGRPAGPPAKQSESTAGA